MSITLEKLASIVMDSVFAALEDRLHVINDTMAKEFIRGVMVKVSQTMFKVLNGMPPTGNITVMQNRLSRHIGYRQHEADQQLVVLQKRIFDMNESIEKIVKESVDRVFEQDEKENNK